MLDCVVQTMWTKKGVRRLQERSGLEEVLEEDTIVYRQRVAPGPTWSNSAVKVKEPVALGEVGKS